VLSANSPVSNVDFEIVTTGVLSSITGRVIDDTGKGIAGADVHGYSSDDTYTDMDGYYTLYVKPGEEYHIEVEAFGYTYQNKDKIAAGSKNVDFTLTPCKATISGTVIDANGYGVLGAEINWDGVVTNRFGRYCLYVPEGSTNYSVYAQGIDSATSRKTANAGDTNVDFQLLYHNSTISGKVCEPDGITPLGGACVSGSYWSSSNTVSDYGNTYTNPDGSYELRVLEGYQYRVSVWKHGYSSPSDKDVPAPNTAIDFIMPGKMPGKVTGAVRDTMGSPTRGALIEVMKDNIPIATATATSDEFGLYTITNLPEGTYTLAISRGGYESAAATVTIRADETSSNDFMLDKTNLFYVDDDVKQYGNGSIKYPYYSIQQAVDDCCLSSGGTVSVAAGTYNETVHINKEIALIGAGATQTTITSYWFGNTNTVTFDGTVTAKTVISGFKITGAWNLSGGGTGIYCSSFSSPVITNNTISGNTKSGIYCYSSSPIITNNTISGNNWIGIYCSSSSPTITNNTISGNNEDGIYCFSSSPNIYNNIITQNGTIIANCYGIYNSGGS
ncbi:MAG: carboxypeptidase regulatory-like domain-containing protein, partial [Candidatus Desantisbacteria bacterium]